MECASSKLTEEQLDELREAFAVYDTDGDGKIRTRELGTVMRQLGRNPTEKEILEISKMLGPSLTFNEFTLLMADRLEIFDTKKAVREAFRVFDVNGNGLISAVELRHVLTTIGEKLTRKEANEMMRVAGTNCDGLINCDDFINLMIPK